MRKKKRRTFRKPKRVHVQRFKDNQGNYWSADELIFPIVIKDKSGSFKPAGSGYFVHPSGGFVTASHVLYINGELQEAYVVHTITKRQRVLRKVVDFVSHPKADIGIGMLGKKVVDHVGNIVLRASFPISTAPIKIGDTIKTYAFPNASVKIKNGEQT